ncbi:hypothetical protein Gorai_001499, partial [Gossypium raimondii]|nr:hypothetical protein [Gossypium raimondii]
SEVVRELKQGVQGDNGDGDVNGNTRRYIWYWIKLRKNFIIYHLGLVAAVFLKWVGPFFIDKSTKASTWSAADAIIGNLIDLGDKPHRSLAKLAQIHGPVMSLKLSSLITVVVSSETMAK